jgi:hypothetical protein
MKGKKKRRQNGDKTLCNKSEDEEKNMREKKVIIIQVIEGSSWNYGMFMINIHKSLPTGTYS